MRSVLHLGMSLSHSFSLLLNTILTLSFIIIFINCCCSKIQVTQKLSYIQLQGSLFKFLTARENRTNIMNLFKIEICKRLFTSAEVLVTHGISLFVLDALRSHRKVPSSPAVNCHREACLMTPYLF